MGLAEVYQAEVLCTEVLLVKPETFYNPHQDMHCPMNPCKYIPVASRACPMVLEPLPHFTTHRPFYQNSFSC